MWALVVVSESAFNSSTLRAIRDDNDEFAIRATRGQERASIRWETEEGAKAVLATERKSECDGMTGDYFAPIAPFNNHRK